MRGVLKHDASINGRIDQVVNRLIFGDEVEPSPLRYEEVIVTPEMARAWLDDPDRIKNRPIDTVLAQQFAAWMGGGKFKATHQGLALDQFGRLLDGQHRLTGVVIYGRPVRMMVCFGARREDMEWIDTHKRRSNVDILAIDGVPATTHSLATARAMMFDYKDGSKLAVDIIREFYVLHFDAIQFAQQVLNKPGLGSAPVRAVIGRAFYTVDVDRLRAFITCMNTIQCDDPSDIAAVKFSAWAMSAKFSSTSARRASLYERCQYCLKAFLDRRPVSTVRAIEGVLYPIPGDPTR
jgi:hypothetical protein